MTHQEPLAAASCAELSEAFSAHAPVVWRVLRRHGVDNDSLEDGTHDVFVIAQRKWHTFEERGSRRAWLIGIAVRVAKTYRNKHQRSAGPAALTPTGNIPDSPSATATPFETTDRRQREELLQTLLSRLSPIQESLIVLTVLEDHSLTEAAAALGLARRRAYYERDKGLAALAKLLGAALGAKTQGEPRP